MRNILCLKLYPCRLYCVEAGCWLSAAASLLAAHRPGPAPAHPTDSRRRLPFGRHHQRRGFGRAQKNAFRRKPAAAPPKPAIAPGTYRVRGLNSRVSRKLHLRPDGTPDFVNINKYPFFEDKKALKAIAKAEKRRQYHQTRLLLEDYVAQFGSGQL